MAAKEKMAKVTAAKDDLEGKKRQAEATQRKAEAAKEKAEAAREKAEAAKKLQADMANPSMPAKEKFAAAKKLQDAKNLEYLRGKNGTMDKMLAAKDKANRAASSVDQKKMELGQAQDLVKRLIEKIEKGGGK